MRLKSSSLAQLTLEMWFKIWMSISYIKGLGVQQIIWRNHHLPSLARQYSVTRRKYFSTKNIDKHLDFEQTLSGEKVIFTISSLLYYDI